VVGVAANTKVRDIHEPAPVFFLYLPLAQSPVATMTLHVRTSGPTENVLPSLRSAVHEIDANVPLADVNTMRHYVDASLWQERILASLFSALGILALVLAVIGMYGVMAFRAIRRRKEIATRLALGATRGKVVRSVVGEAALTAGIGVILGGIAARYFLSPFLASQLAGLDAQNALSFSGAGLFLFLIALAASLLPAVKMASTDPNLSLRSG
jgi:ABC-type antimicrobial peptide transport system permease subunit